MDAVRHIALGCCVISTVAGMIRVFWPENGFTPVINAVLVLYIIAAGLQMLRGTDWHSLAAHLYDLGDMSVQATDYTAYGQALTYAASVEAVRDLLRQAGIDAVVTLQEDVCRVELARSSDCDRARALLEADCGDLAWEIVTEGSMP